jgi:hypothetical protein
MCSSNLNHCPEMVFVNDCRNVSLHEIYPMWMDINAQRVSLDVLRWCKAKTYIIIKESRADYHRVNQMLNLRHWLALLCIDGEISSCYDPTNVQKVDEDLGL